LEERERRQHLLDGLHYIRISLNARRETADLVNQSDAQRVIRRVLIEIAARVSFDQHVLLVHNGVAVDLYYLAGGRWASSFDNLPTCPR
jgi:hypothetical protein